jgi:hypothetical protein
LVAGVASSLVYADIRSVASTLLGSAVLAGSVICAARCTRPDRLLFARCLLLVAALASFFAVAQQLGVVSNGYGYLSERGSGGLVGQNNILGGHWARSTGTFGHPIVLSMLLAVAACEAACGATLRRNTMRVSMVAVCLVGILASGTRSAIIALGLGLIYWLFQLRTGRWWRLPLGALGLAAGGVGLADLLAQASGELSYTHRMASLRGIADLISSRSLLENLIGSGGDMGRLVAGGFMAGADVLAVDNEFVRTLAVSGIVGLGLLTMWILRSLRRLSPTGRVAGCVILVFWFFFDAFLWSVPALLTACVLAGALPAGGAQQRESVPARDLEPVTP